MYIQVSKDINKIRNTVVSRFTWRDIVILSTFGVFSFILYHIMKDYISYKISTYILSAFLIFPAFLLFYNKNGMQPEKLLFYKIKRFINGKIRPYKTENLYAQIEKEIKKQEVKKIAVSNKNSKQKNTVNKEAKKSAAKNSAAKHTVSGHEKRRNLHGKQRLLHKDNAV